MSNEETEKPPKKPKVDEPRPTSPPRRVHEIGDDSTMRIFKGEADMNDLMRDQLNRINKQNAEKKKDLESRTS